MVALVVAGEAIFLLPFVFPRVFKPTILEVFGLTNSELGTAFAFYGIVAMVAYALGGPLADLFQPRRLLAIALVATALGGVLLWRIPSHSTLKWIYGYWGLRPSRIVVRTDSGDARVGWPVGARLRIWLARWRGADCSLPSRVRVWSRCTCRSCPKTLRQHRWPSAPLR
ncbi:MAG: MFS transporter [Phycisphaerae bacterium]